VAAIAAGLKAGTRDGESLVVSDPWKTPLRVRARESRAVDRNGIPSPA
jgi:hypothetical protein